MSYKDAAQHLKSARFASNQVAHLSMSSARFQSVNIEKYSDLDSEIILSHNRIQEKNVDLANSIFRFKQSFFKKVRYKKEVTPNLLIWTFFFLIHGINLLVVKSKIS